jgi:hypothetical protein
LIDDWRQPSILNAGAAVRGLYAALQIRDDVKLAARLAAQTAASGI